MVIAILRNIIFIRIEGREILYFTFRLNLHLHTHHSNHYYFLINLNVILVSNLSASPSSQDISGQIICSKIFIFISEFLNSFHSLVFYSRILQRSRKFQILFEITFSRSRSAWIGTKTYLTESENNNDQDDEYISKILKPWDSEFCS